METPRRARRGRARRRDVRARRPRRRARVEPRLHGRVRRAAAAASGYCYSTATAIAGVCCAPNILTRRLARRSRASPRYSPARTTRSSGSELAGARAHRAAPFGTSYLALADKARGGPERPVPAARATWSEEIASRAAEAAALELDAQKSVQRNVVADLGARLRELLGKNAAAPEIERLERDAFVVDVAGRDATAAASAARAEAHRAGIRADDARKARAAVLLKDECWEAMDVHHKECRAFLADGPGAVATNFALAKRSSAERKALERVKRLRVLELRDMQARGAKGGAGGVWPRRNDEVPRDVAWVVNEGRLRPVLDVVEAARSAAPGDAAKARRRRRGRRRRRRRREADADGGEGEGEGASGAGGADDDAGALDAGWSTRTRSSRCCTRRAPRARRARSARRSRCSPSSCTRCSSRSTSASTSSSRARRTRCRRWATRTCASYSTYYCYYCYYYYYNYY